MTEYTYEFTEYLRKNGYGAAKSSDIIADDCWHDYQLQFDRIGKKKGVYILNVRPNGAIAQFGDWREGGAIHTWKSGNTKSFIGSEKAAWAAEQRRIKADNDKKLKALRDKAAKTAQELWNSAREAKANHPYLVAKRIKPHGVKQLNGTLLVPMYLDGVLSSLQRISADGEKRMLWNGEKKGAAFVLGEIGSQVAVCEGYATGASIFEATGIPVAVAFDAGNLKPVAVSLREKYPAAEIILAADNDQWTFIKKHRPFGLVPSDIDGDDQRWGDWRRKGYLVNIGKEKALEAAALVKGKCVWPNIPENDKSKRTDFNDINNSEILAAFGLQEGGSVSVPCGNGLQDATPTFIPWVRKQSGELDEKSLINTELMLEHDAALTGLFCYDSFSHEKLVQRCPPWDDPDSFTPRPLTDDDITCLTIELERRGLKMAIQVVRQVVSAIIKRNQRNPAREYFDSLVWDGNKRLDNWLIYYCGAEFDDLDYVRCVGAKWLCAAVARVFEPGTKFDHMLILEGEQYGGKSFILEQLATIHGKRYFDDTLRVHDLGTPAVVPRLQGVLIVEVQELSGFKRKDADELKQAITTKVDRIIRKYENEVTTYPRQFVFAGTINPQDGYLHDPTGNRRFWPVKTGGKMDTAAMEKDKEQLWAEAVVRWRAGEKLYLDDNMFKKANAVQANRYSEHPWHAILDSLSTHKDFVSNDDIWEVLAIERAKRMRPHQDEISKIMTNLGFERSRNRVEKLLKYGWVRKAVKDV